LLVATGSFTYNSNYNKSLSESPWHLISWQIFRHMHANLIDVHAAYVSEIYAHLTEIFAKRFREAINRKKEDIPNA